MKNVIIGTSIGLLVGFAVGEKVQSVRQQRRLNKVVPMLSIGVGNVVAKALNESMSEEEVLALLRSEMEFFNIAFKLV